MNEQKNREEKKRKETREYFPSFPVPSFHEQWLFLVSRSCIANTKIYFALESVRGIDCIFSLITL